MMFQWKRNHAISSSTFFRTLAWYVCVPSRLVKTRRKRVNWSKNDCVNRKPWLVIERLRQTWMERYKVFTLNVNHLFRPARTLPFYDHRQSLLHLQLVVYFLWEENKNDYKRKKNRWLFNGSIEVRNRETVDERTQTKWSRMINASFVLISI